MIRVSVNRQASAGTAIAFSRMGSRSWCSRAFTALAVVLALPSLAVAQTNGTWTRTANGTYTWSDTANWSGGIVAGGTGSVASLTADTAAGGGTLSPLQTINLNATVSTGTLRWADTNATGLVYSYGIAPGTGGALNMATSDGSTPTILFTGTSQNQLLLISAPITGTQGLRISSTATPSGSLFGQVNLSGTSTFTGNITIDGASTNFLNLVDTGRLGATGTFAGDISIGTGATVTAWHSGLQTLSGNVSGAGGIRMIASAYNTGTLALTGSNAFTGTISVNGVVAGSATQGRVLLLGNADAMRNATLSSSTSALENAGTRTVQFAPGIGTFNLGGIAAGGLGTGNIGLTDTSSNAITLAVGHNNLASSYSGTFFGAGNLTKVGSGTLTLSAANTYTGTTAVNGGVLTISNAAALGTTGTITFGGGTLQYGSGITADLSARIRSSGSAISVDTGANNVTWATGLASTNTGGLTKLGSGALTLSAANNYSGGTTIRNGSVAVTTPANLGAGVIAITPDAGTTTPSLRLNNTVSGTYTQPITMSSASNPAFAAVDASSATAQVTLSGGITVSNNAFLVRLVAPTGTTGSLVVDGNITGTGDLQLTGNGGAGVIQRDINIGSATLNVGSNGSTWSIGGGAYTWGTTNIQLAGSALRTTADGVLPSASALVFSSAAGALDINGTRQTVGSVGSSVAGSRIILGSGTLTVGNTNASTFAGVISGAGGSLVKTNSGTLTLSNANTYTGPTAVNGGVLAMDNAAALGTGTITFGGGTLQYGSGITADLSGRIAASGSAIAVDTGTNNVTWATGLASTNTGGLTKSGSGTLTLSAANNYSGGTTIRNGSVAVTTPANLGTGAIAITPDAGTTNPSLRLNNTASGTYAQPITMSSINFPAFSVVDASSATAQVTLSGGITLSNNAFLARLVAPTGTTGSLVVDGNITGTGDLQLSGNGGAGVIQKDINIGSATLFVGSNGSTWSIGGGAYTWGTTNIQLAGSALRTTADNVLPSASALVFSGNAGALDINGTRQTVGSVGSSVAGSRIILGSGTLTVSNTNASSFAGVISGAGGSLVKTNSGTLTLSGSSTYSGATTIAAGRLVVGNAAALGASSAAIAVNGGTLDLGGFSVGVGALSGSAGAVITTGSTTGTATLTSAVASGTSIFGGVIQDNGSGFVALAKSGAGVLALTGANTYSGATSVSAGTLLVTGQLGNTAVTVDSGATLGGSGSIAGAVTVNGFLSPGTSPGVLSAASLVLGASSTSVFEIDGLTRGTQYDGVNITGLGGPTYGGTLSLSFLTSFDNDTTFDLFNFSGTPTGDFTTVISSGAYAGTWSQVTSGTWRLESGSQTVTFSQATGDIVVVPEPAALALAAIGIAAAAWIRRRSPSKPLADARG